MSVLFGAIIIFIGSLIFSAVLVGIVFVLIWINASNNKDDQLDLPLEPTLSPLEQDLDEHDPAYQPETKKPRASTPGAYALMQDVSKEDIDRAKERIEQKQKATKTLTILN